MRDERWRAAASRVAAWHAAPVVVAVLALFYYWFAIADRYIVFLYDHDLGPRVPDTMPFSDELGPSRVFHGWVLLHQQQQQLFSGRRAAGGAVGDGCGFGGGHWVVEEATGEEMMEHETFMRKAIELAIASGKKGNHSFGAVLVHEGKVIASAENTEVTGEGYGHAEYNLAIQSAQQFPECVLRECTFYTSATPCPRCTFAILAIGVRRIAISVSYEAFARLIPDQFTMLSVHDIVERLALEDVEILEPILEEEGMRAFEHWGGEHRPLEELLEEARRGREEKKDR